MRQFIKNVAGLWKFLNYIILASAMLRLSPYYWSLYKLIINKDYIKKCKSKSLKRKMPNLLSWPRLRWCRKSLNLRMKWSKRSSINFRRPNKNVCSRKSHGLKSKKTIMSNLSFSPHHFKRVKISATALVKMVMHTRRGGDLEVMGMMQGKARGGKFHLIL